jgi:hypothetical protein
MPGWFAGAAARGAGRGREATGELWTLGVWPRQARKSWHGVQMMQTKSNAGNTSGELLQNGNADFLSFFSSCIDTDELSSETVDLDIGPLWPRRATCLITCYETFWLNEMNRLNRCLD